MEEAAAELEQAEDFSRTVDAAVALLRRVEVELTSDDDSARAESRPIARGV